MSFTNLLASRALRMESYDDIDHFRESERYVQASSIPLRGKEFSVRRASLTLPSSTLSLVRTFPRIINGYDLSGRLVVVVPMDDVSSARVNGRQTGQSLILLNGRADCTVYEPEARLVAVLSISPGLIDSRWLEFAAGHRLLRLPSTGLTHLRTHVRALLELAASEPDALSVDRIPEHIQGSLFKSFDEVACLGVLDEPARHKSLDRYKTIVDRVDDLIGADPINLSTAQLADEVGISLRTLQTATQTVCGSGIHHYSRLRRLWSVRRQLRTGAPGLTVKASALAHGFWHMSEFSKTYHGAFDELPSQTLARSRN